MRIFSFIFARGGSKGLPKKNIKKLNGKPLITYSINLSNNLKEIEKTFVSTDSDEIIYESRFFPKINGLILYLSLKQIKPKCSIKQMQLNEPSIF